MGTQHKHAEVIKAHLHKFKYLPNGDLVWSDNFGARARKDCLCGSIDSSGYRQIKIGNTPVLSHRIIWMMFNDSYPEQIDHIDRNRQNNRIENLRASTNATNQHNATTRKDNTSGYVGVNEKGDKWQARIAAFGKRIHLGTFELKQDAIAAYKNAKEIHHGRTA